MSHSSFEGYLIDPMNGSNRVIKEETETEMHSTETPYPMDVWLLHYLPGQNGIL